MGVELGGLTGASNSIIGPRRALLLGASIFIVASAFGGFAVTPAMFIAARVLQGLGAALGLVLGGVLTTSSHRALSTVAHRAYGRCA